MKLCLIRVKKGMADIAFIEQAYYTAWSHAKSHRPSPEPKHTPAQRALCEFIDNWTNEEFVGFVNDCEELVDGLIGVDSDLKGRCEEVSSFSSGPPAASIAVGGQSLRVYRGHVVAKLTSSLGIQADHLARTALLADRLIMIQR